MALALVGGCACDPGPQPRRVRGQLVPSADVVAFGATTLGVPVVRTLSLTQRGLAPAYVHSVSVQPDEGVFRPGTLPQIIGRDGVEVLEIEYAPVEAREHRAELVFGMEDGIEVRVTVEGKGVDARATFDPVVDFGRPALGNVRRRTLVLSNSQETPVPVKLRLLGTDAAEFAATEALRVAPFGNTEVSLRYEPVGRPGPREAELEVVPCPLCAPTRVSLTGDAVETALVIRPDPVRFGGVSVDSRRRVELSITNATDEPVALHRIELEAGTDAGFELDGATSSLVLGELDTATLDVLFSPVHLGAAEGAIVVTSDAFPTPVRRVPLAADGGGAQLVVAPLSLDFRTVPTSGRWVLPVTIANGGADPASPPLRILGTAITGPSFSIDTDVAPGTALAAGDRIEARVAFHPTAEGDWRGTFTVFSDDVLAPAVDVELRGIGGLAADCVLQVTPSHLSFGAVQPGRGAILGIRVENVGADECSLWDGRVEGDSVFAMQRERPLVRLFPGDAMTAPITFHPPTTARHQATFRMETSSATLPRVEVPIDGGGAFTCLVPEPRYVEFGPNRRDCGPLEAEVAFRNMCSAPVSVSSIHLGNGTDLDTFSIAEDDAPTTLAPGATANARVLYEPGSLGSSYRPLFAKGEDSDLPTLLPLAAETLVEAEHDELYVQPTPAKLDLLWVVDNTASMKDEREALRTSISSFLSQADALGIDYRMGVTTTGVGAAPPGNDTEPCPGGVSGGEAGRLFPVDHSRPRIVDPSMPDRAAVLAANVEVGGCHSIEQGLEAARLALSPPLVDNPDHPRTPEPNDGNLGLVRPDAALAVVLVSDEDDQSPGGVDALIRSLRRVKRSSPMTFSAIVAPPGGCASAVEPGTRYLSAVSAIGGVAASVCDSDWSGSLAAIADDLFRERNRFVLEARAEPSSLVVTLDDVPTSAWTYDDATHAIVFDTPPSPGVRVRIRYSEPCPSR